MTVTRDDGSVVCERCEVARTAFQRTKGLLGKRELPRGEGLLIQRTSSIHMFFMRFPIDAVFVDRDLVVRKVVRDLKPWRMAFAFGAKWVLELPAGEAERRRVVAGQQLVLS